MFWDIVEFIEFLGCVNSLGDSGGGDGEGKRSAQKRRLRQGLSNKANWAMVDKGNGIVAFDPKAGKFGVVLAAAPAVFFTKKQVLSAEIPSGDPTLLRVSVNQSGGPWSQSLRFRSKEKARRWLDYLMDRP